MDAKALFEFVTISDFAREYIEKEEFNNSEITGLRSGFKQFDEMFKGFQPGELIIVSGYNAIYADAFLENISMNISRDQKIPVAFFSLGKSHLRMMMHLVSSLSEIDLLGIQFRLLESEGREQLGRLLKRIPDIPLHIHADTGLTVPQINQNLKLNFKDSSKAKPGLVVIDYLQLINDWEVERTRKEEVGAILSELKELARELEIPIIVSSLFYPDCRMLYNNRNLKDRPILADFLNAPETAFIEKFADGIIFCHRETTLGENGGPAILDGNVELIVAKSSTGRTGVVYMNYDCHSGRIFRDGD